MRVAELDPESEENLAGPRERPLEAPPLADTARKVADQIESGLEAYNPYDPKITQTKELAYRMVVLGERLPAACTAVGIGYQTAWKIARQPQNPYHGLFKAEQAYWFAKAADGRRAIYRETESLIDEAVVQSARNIHQIVHDPETPLGLRAEVSNKTLDRGGVRAPEKIQQKIEIELGEDTLRRMAAARAEVAGIDRKRVLADQFAYALDRPRSTAASLRAAIQDRDRDLDSEPDEP